MSNAVKRLKEEYQAQYGHIPDDPVEQMKYLCESLGIDEKLKQKYDAEAEEILSMPWKEASLYLPLTPMAEKRPRSSADGHFYVPDIATHRKLVQSYIDFEGIVYTLCNIHIDIYVEMPKSFSKRDMYLAQMKVIQPFGPDWDNYAKTYCDCIQNLVIINDNIIVDGTCRKFYAIKPHVLIDLKYRPMFESKYNERRIQSSKSYLRNIERVKTNEYTTANRLQRNQKSST